MESTSNRWSSPVIAAIITGAVDNGCSKDVSKLFTVKIKNQSGAHFSWNE